MSWQTVLGFEIHIELATASKMFCGCPADHFGKPPNTQTCPVCLGLPGALSVPNAKAIEWCIKLGLALDCQINPFSKFDRKNYFYPDLPKGYQISQYDQPFCHHGHLLGHRITRVHLEEDTGKLIHSGQLTLIDFNRSGVPLVEVVTEPDFTNADDAIEFLKEIQLIVRTLNISAADMEKGSMRLEANVSLKPAGSPRLPNYKVEIKNVNSFRFIKKAVGYEIMRQSRLLESGAHPIQETRGFQESTGQTVAQRAKEQAHDYRYFPEPDIPPFRFTPAQISAWRRQLPELPSQTRQKLISQYGLSPHYARIISSDKDILKKFLAKSTPDMAASLVNKRPLAQTVSVSEEKLKETIAQVVAVNPQAVSDYRSGRRQAMFFLVGQVKKRLGQIDVLLTQKIINEIIGS